MSYLLMTKASQTPRMNAALKKRLMTTIIKELSKCTTSRNETKHKALSTAEAMFYLYPALWESACDKKLGAVSVKFI